MSRKGSSSANTKSPSNQAQSGRKRKRSRGRKRQDPRKFWGDMSTMPEAIYGLEATEAADALVGSLGKPPIPGHETSARHYFDLVYDRTVNLAFALAAAGGLDKDAPAPLPTLESPAQADEDPEPDEAED
jgi:hypothetical protein